ncbi:hypothetical protein ACE5IS_03770 [Leptospira wolffii]|uniref:Uncharacterized protein n=1 Tax=Leptospira wolffii TaxID=409998 RepID=A0ABV5BKX2_9LEPT|nr:hypothetical protein [Leptospira wolffii]EPG67847.1 hypothetical protein LEP1GSC061_0453 [Leptospira wolffii serovar Khorat str. Khorat-H2]
MSEDLKSKARQGRRGIWKRFLLNCWEILPHGLRRQLVAMSGQSDLDF